MAANEIVILEDFTFDTIKTKKMVEVLNNLKVNGKKNMFLFSETNMNVVLSARNIQRTTVALARNINTYDILNAKNIFILESAIKPIEDILG